MGGDVETPLGDRHATIDAEQGRARSARIAPQASPRTHLGDLDNRGQQLSRSHKAVTPGEGRRRRESQLG